jgi:hypothetical protein
MEELAAALSELGQDDRAEMEGVDGDSSTADGDFDVDSAIQWAFDKLDLKVEQPSQLVVTALNLQWAAVLARISEAMYDDKSVRASKTTPLALGAAPSWNASALHFHQEPELSGKPQWALFRVTRVDASMGNSRLVLAFRGTVGDVKESISSGKGDWMKNIEAVAAKFPGFQTPVVLEVHRGWATTLVSDAIEGAGGVYAHLEKQWGSDTSMWVTGHSLGGAYAQLTQLFLLGAKCCERAVHVATFGAPQVVSCARADAGHRHVEQLLLKHGSELHCIVHGDDAVPRIYTDANFALKQLSAAIGQHPFFPFGRYYFINHTTGTMTRAFVACETGGRLESWLKIRPNFRLSEWTKDHSIGGCYAKLMDKLAAGAPSEAPVATVPPPPPPAAAPLPPSVAVRCAADVSRPDTDGVATPNDTLHHTRPPSAAAAVAQAAVVPAVVVRSSAADDCSGPGDFSACGGTQVADPPQAPESPGPEQSEPTAAPANGETVREEEAADGVSSPATGPSRTPPPASASARQFSAEEARLTEQLVAGRIDAVAFQEQQVKLKAERTKAAVAAELPSPVTSPTPVTAGGLPGKVRQIKEALQLDASLPMPAAIKQANEMMEIEPQGGLPTQVALLMAELEL